MAARRSTRRRFDDDGWDAPTDLIIETHDVIDHTDADDPDEPSWSTYRDATQGTRTRAPDGW